MDSIFKICKVGSCNLQILGLEKDNDEYLNEDTQIIVSTRNYAYSQTVTVNALISIDSKENRTIQAHDIINHTISPIDESTLSMPIDGLYDVAHIILPTDTWLKYVLERDSTALEAYSNIYIYNETSETFQKYIDKQLIDVELAELLEFNAAPPSSVLDKTHTIIRGDKNIFCTCYINECFYKLAKKVLGQLTNCPAKEVSQDVYNRDIVWMTINVIKYLIEMKQFYEAQRILESVLGCRTICKDPIPNRGGSGCGCSN